MSSSDLEYMEYIIHIGVRNGIHNTSMYISASGKLLDCKVIR